MIHNKIIERIQSEAHEDCRALWKIVSYAACDTGRDEDYDEDDPTVAHPNSITDPELIKAKTLTLVCDLLNTKRMMAGGLADGGRNIEPWPIPVEAVVARIEREWKALGKEPDMRNDIVWLGRCTPEEWPHKPQNG